MSIAMNEKIKQRRLDLGLTLLDVAQAVNVSEATVSRWESGDIANMRRDRIALLANVLKVSPSYLIGWDEGATSQSDLSEPYFRLAKEAQDKQIDPEDIRDAIDIVQRLRKPNGGRKNEAPQ